MVGPGAGGRQRRPRRAVVAGAARRAAAEPPGSPGGVRFRARQNRSAHGGARAGRIARTIADGQHVAYFNAAGLFEATGDLPAAYTEYEHALLAATSLEDLDDAAVGLRRVAPEAEDPAHLLPADELEARAQRLGRGVIDLAAFGADLPSLVDQYTRVAGRRRGGGADPATSDPARPSPPCGPSLRGRRDRDCSTRRTWRYRGRPTCWPTPPTSGSPGRLAISMPAGRERVLDEPDRLEVEGGGDDGGIAGLRFAVNGPGFCNHTRATRSAAEAELGRLLMRRAQRTRRPRRSVRRDSPAPPAVSAAPEWRTRYWLANAELGLFRSTGSEVCLERARYLFVDLIGHAAADDPDITPCLYFRAIVGLGRSSIYGHPGDLGVSLLAVDRAIDLLESSAAADGRGDGPSHLERASAVRSQIVDEMATVEEVSGALPAILERDALVVLDTALEEASFAEVRREVVTLDRIRGALRSDHLDGRDSRRGGRSRRLYRRGAGPRSSSPRAGTRHRSQRRSLPSTPRRTVWPRGRALRRADPRSPACPTGVDGDPAAADATSRLRQMVMTGVSGDAAKTVARRAALAWGDAAWRRDDADEAAEAYDSALSLVGAALSGWMYRKDQLEELAASARRSSVLRSPTSGAGMPGRQRWRASKGGLSCSARRCGSR